jgi:ABC-type antimicrobial peptide transport system permease subunit
MLKIYWERLSRNRLALAGLAFIALLALVAVFAAWISPRGSTHAKSRGAFTRTLCRALVGDR